jgi:hypothetical protein
MEAHSFSANSAFGAFVEVEVKEHNGPNPIFRPAGLALPYGS